MVGPAVAVEVLHMPHICSAYVAHVLGMCQEWSGRTDPGHRGSDPLKLPELQGVQPPVVYLPLSVLVG